MEVRRKTEAHLAEVRRKLEEEQSKRAREMNNNQQVNDKINFMEKQAGSICNVLLLSHLNFNLNKNSLNYT